MNTLSSSFKKITVVPLICQDYLKPKVGCHEIKWKIKKVVISWFERFFFLCLAKGCMLLMKMKLFNISGSGELCGKQNCRSFEGTDLAVTFSQGGITLQYPV